MTESNRGGFQSTATADASSGADSGTDPVTDCGHSRRVFLGAAAALASLPVTGTTAEASEHPTGEAGAPAGQTTNYDRQTVLTTSGQLELYAGNEQRHDTSVTVASHPEGVTLQLANDIGAITVLLLSEDISLLCQQLRIAQEKTHPDDVKDARAWMADYRGGETDAE